MVPLVQQEYAKYLQLFRGNHYKGRTFLKSLLLNSDRAEEVVNSLSACTSIFADVRRSNVDAMCASLLSTYPDYFESALMTYLNGNELSELPSTTALLTDTDEIVRLYSVPDAWNPLMFSNYFTSNLFTLKSNFDIFCVDPTKQYLNILTDPELLPKYATVHNKKVSVNHRTAIQAAITAANYTVYQWEGAHYIEKWGQLLQAVTVRDASNYYYPLIVRWTMATNTAEIVLVDTVLKSTSTNYNCARCGYPAYDPDNDVVYAFYNHATQQNNIYCAAAQLTATTATTLFTAKIVGAKSTGNSYYQILNVSAGQGKASCCWFNNYYLSNNSNTCIAYCTVLQDGTVQTSNAALLSNINTPNFSGSTTSQVAGLESYAQGYHWYRYFYGQYVYLGAHVPIALPNGTFTLSTLQRQLYTTNDYSGNASINIQYTPRKNIILFYSGMTADGTNVQTQYHVVYNSNVMRTVSGPSIGAQQGFQGLKYDAFSDLLYFGTRNTANTAAQWNRLSVAGLATIDATEWNGFPNTATGAVSIGGAIANTAKYVGWRDASNIWNIEPNLLTTL